MITVTVEKDPSGFIKKFTVSGHAGYADAGEDIVCSAVSSLVLTTINGLEYIAKVPLTYDIDDNGYVCCSLTHKMSEEERQRAHLLCETMLLGLSLTAEEYPEFIEIYLKDHQGGESDD